jgi:hypothetical protein
LFGVERKQAHELERVRMPCIERKRPLATGLGFKLAARLEMAMACGVERSGRAPAGTAWNRLGFTGG